MLKISKKSYLLLSGMFILVSALPPLPFDSESSIELPGKKSISKKHHKFKSSELYLPRSVYPTSYKIKIRPILPSTNANSNESLTAPGHVEINVSCKQATDVIILHAHTREFIKILDESVKVYGKNEQNNGTMDEGKSRNIQAIGHSSGKEDSDFYTIDLEETLEPGENYVIAIHFVTKISNSTLDGLYLSQYVDPATEQKKYLAVTQFEDIAARQMFPCFDEPDLKASFQLTISRPENLNSMSNMNLEYSEPDPEHEGYVLDHYPPTPPMSTYLVALVVSDFKCVTADYTAYNVTVQACGPPYMVDQNGADHAAMVSAKILHFYEKLWGVRYPLSKMQSIGIPQFEAGAMENYGLNTYRIAALMYFPGKTTEARRRQIESTIAHELAHQNFGNLVTCQTWNNIFLNEGFATYVSDLGVEEVSPEFKVKYGDWYTSYFQRALLQDAHSETTHAVVETEEYFGDFDAISYSKGSSLIKMMEHVLSKETLFNGLRTYLKRFSFGNTHYENLFETLDEEARGDGHHPGLASVSEIMKTWTLHPGFPLIRVARVFNKMYYISQEKFTKAPLKLLGTRDAEPDSEPNYIPTMWYCPIFISTSQIQEKSKPTLWLSNKESIKAYVVKEEVDWIIINEGSKAFFRVLYDEKLSQHIVTQLQKDFTVFSPITRAQLIDDAFECAWSHYSSITIGLERTSYLLRENEPIVWSTVLNHFKEIYKMISEDDAALMDFQNYIRPRVESALRFVGVEQQEEDKGKIVLHRTSLLRWATLLGLPSVLEYAKRLVTENYKIPVDIEEEMLCAAVAEGSASSLTSIFNLYQNEKKDATERRKYVVAMGCSNTAASISKLLEDCMNKKVIVSVSDCYVLLQKLANNPKSRSQTFLHIRNNLKEFEKYFGDGNWVAKIAETISQFWNTENQLSLMKEFAKEMEASKGIVEKCISNVEKNMIWMKIHGKELKSWFQQTNRS